MMPRMEERDNLDEKIKDMEADAEGMERRSEELDQRVRRTRSDWRAKQADPAVPGAQPSPDDET